MIACLNERLTSDVWTEIVAPSDCYLYSIRADQNRLSFKMKKSAGDSAYWTVEPKKEAENMPSKAQITVSLTDPLSGTLFYLKAASAPVDVEIFLS